jgi:DNA-binding GntR family transcriptional regulator
MIEADRAFHDALVQASGNSVLLEMLPTLSDRTRLLLELNPPRSGEMLHGDLLRGLRGHQRILEALLEGDQEHAAQALRDELTSGRERVLEQMAGAGE